MASPPTLDDLAARLTHRLAEIITTEQRFNDLPIKPYLECVRTIDGQGQSFYQFYLAKRDEAIQPLAAFGRYNARRVAVYQKEGSSGFSLRYIDDSHPDHKPSQTAAPTGGVEVSRFGDLVEHYSREILRYLEGALAVHHQA